MILADSRQFAIRRSLLQVLSHISTKYLHTRFGKGFPFDFSYSSDGTKRADED